MSGSWRHVATAYYGLRAPLLWQTTKNYSRHFFIYTAAESFVLSRVRKDPRRPPFTDQFAAISALRAAGFTLAHLPRRTVDGRLYIEVGSDYWYLRDYLAQSAPAGANDRLVADAAVTLAALHRAGRAGLHSIPMPATQGLEPFHWPVVDAIAGLRELLPYVNSSALRSAERAYVEAVAGRLTATAPAALSRGTSLGLIGLTHHDFRPDNLIVRDDRVVAVLDWDRTYPDHQMYDVAFAALQFGDHQCLLPPLHARSAGRFLPAYIDARFGPAAPHDVRHLAAWMMLFVVTRRLLLGGDTRARLRLLHDVHDGLAGDALRWAAGDGCDCARARGRMYRS